jgi:hypothetical protein
MAGRVIFNRNFACTLCGKVRRAAAAGGTHRPPVPQCCDRAMRLLSYEQVRAAARLSASERAEWLAAGGRVVERGGKRGWKATW